MAKFIAESSRTAYTPACTVPPGLHAMGVGVQVVVDQPSPYPSIAAPSSVRIGMPPSPSHLSMFLPTARDHSGVRATLVWDGECGFCKAWAMAARDKLPRDVDVIPWQEADLAALGLTEDAD